MSVKYKDEIHEVFDIDEGYGYLALDGDKYAYPNCETNNCISAPMKDCEIIDKPNNSNES